jgi:hypothetical protein
LQHMQNWPLQATAESDLKKSRVAALEMGASD